MLARKQATFWKAWVSVCCDRNALAFVWTYSVTAERISMPVTLLVSAHAAKTIWSDSSYPAVVCLAS